MNGISVASADASKDARLTRVQAVRGGIALALASIYMVFAIIAWTVFLVDKPLEYRQYDLLVLLVWETPRWAAIVTIFLIKNAGQDRFAKLAKTGAWRLAILVPGFWIAWGGRLPISHLLEHHMGFHFSCDEGAIRHGISTNYESRTLLMNMLCNATLVPVSKPHNQPDYEIIFYMQGKDADTITRTCQLCFSLDSIYVCHYYSKEGILADERSGEYVRVPAQFRTWVLNAMK